MAQKTLHSRFSKRIICRPGLTKHTHTRSHTRTQSARVWLKIGKSSTWQDMNHFSLLVPATVGQKPGVRVPFYTNKHTHKQPHKKMLTWCIFNPHARTTTIERGGGESRPPCSVLCVWKGPQTTTMKHSKFWPLFGWRKSQSRLQRYKRSQCCMKESLGGGAPCCMNHINKVQVANKCSTNYLINISVLFIGQGDCNQLAVFDRKQFLIRPCNFNGFNVIKQQIPQNKSHWLKNCIL